ncbi:TonB family protein [Rivularia sp. PCC 7116]|uniref:energy transducer TonB n=1 Tax=Rivularia sp. PCC 7116 TaxID=373994 RepID=UPI00029F1360|nr:energy transducer TonB [Rivularia sp. PCC 7116]AFY58509.1 TonB family protein [Rivularia sp. PCC 7116]
MSFASTALRQRERESKALRIFLACSLASSLIFHLALLASGIGKYLLNRVPDIEDESVEITLLDTPIEEIEPKPKEEVKPKPKPEPKKIEPKLEKPEPIPKPKPEIKQPTIDTSQFKPDLNTTPSQSRISGGSPASSLTKPIPAQSRITQAPPVVKQPIPKADPLPKPNFKPFKEFKPIEPISPVLPSAPPVAVREKPVIPEQKPIPEPEPEIRTPRDFSTPVTPPIEPPKPDEDLKKLLAQERDSRRTPRDFSTPVTPPIEPPKPDEDLEKLLAQERDSRRTARSFSTPVEPEAPAVKPDEGLKDLLAQERDSRRTARSLPNPVTPPMEPPASTPQDSGELRNTLSGIRESRDTNISSNNTAPSLPDTSNIGESSDDAPRRRRRIMGGGNVAAAPTNTTDNGSGNGLGDGSGDSIGDGDGNAACVRCNRSYPSWARNRGIQGSITVSVDADAQGNVTNVRLISGSGNDRLDKHHLKIARRWKLKSSSNGRPGVTIITRYELQ